MSDATYFAVGEPPTADHSCFPRTAALIEAVHAHPFVKLIETRRKDADDVVVVEFEVELPTDPAADIRATERLAIAVGGDEFTTPTVLALRKDFPNDLPHTNLTLAGEPTSLCLFGEPYVELVGSLTPPMFLERIGRWLGRAAMDGLHLPDQPLEPLLLTNERIIIEPDLFDETGEMPLPLFVGARSDTPPILEVLRLPEGTDVKRLNERVRFLALPLTARPWHARLIQSQPRNVEDLRHLLTTVGIDLLAECGKRILRLYDDRQFDTFARSRVLVLLQLPKVRQQGGDEETTEWWAFVLNQPLEELAVRLGVLSQGPGTRSLGRMLGTPTASGLEAVSVYPLKPIFAYTKVLAGLLSGRIAECDPMIVAIGGGALGSQAIMALARQGFGNWTVIDDDVILPHNLARHALYETNVGSNKAEALAQAIRRLLNAQAGATGLACNLLRPGDHGAAVEAALTASQVVVDCSGSPAVGRELAYRADSAPRICAFIAPSGEHLAILAEGRERGVRLDDLDAQLAAAAADGGAVQRAFSARAGSVAYAGSCRDSSVVLPQDVVQLFAGVVARFIRDRWDAFEAFIGLWEWSDQTYSLTNHTLTPFPARVLRTDNWEVRIAARAGAQLRKYRWQRLPNETGGVLLGNVDSRRRVAHIGLALPSPSDSVEWPDMYIRGAEGLREEVTRLNGDSGGQLTYVGEWHSHPNGVSTMPGALDRAAFVILRREMATEGLPTIMLIQGETEEPRLLVG